MPFEVAEAVNFVKDIARDEQVKVSIKYSIKGSLGVCCATAAGGLLLGPIGLAIGGILGGIAVYAAYKDEFVPLPVALANMSEEQKMYLRNRLESIAAGLNATDIAQLSILLAGSSEVRERVVHELVAYIGQEIQVAVA